MIDLGDVHRIRVEVRDPSGSLADPGTATLTITLPDGTSVTPSVSLPPAETGLLIVDYPTVQAGRHSFVLSTTTPQTAYRDVFDVRTPNLTLVVSLADAKNQLNITGNSLDEELRGFVEACSMVVHDFVGSTFQQSYVETHQVCGDTVLLHHAPVVSVDSITGLGGASDIDPVGLDVDEYGTVTLGSAVRGRYRIAYTAGYAVVPANITRAALIIIQHMWETQRVRDVRRPPIAMAEEFQSQQQTGMGWSIPRRAVELLQPHMISGVA